MESWMIEIMKQVPALGVLALLTWQFLVHLSTTNKDVRADSKEQRDAYLTANKSEREAYLKQIKEQSEKFSNTVYAMGQDCHAVQMKCVQALDRNAMLQGRFEVVLDHAVDALVHNDKTSLDQLRKQSEAWKVQDSKPISSPGG